MERDFKGVWIPKEIWLNTNLSLQEKVILVEIDSLDNEDGCFASNKYFANFFNLTNGRVSQIINELKNKGWITLDYEYKDKEIIGRIIKVNRPPYPLFNKLNTYLENYEGGIKNIKGGYLENAKDNNTSINNTNNNKKEIYKEKYGEFKNVLLTEEEYQKLKDKNLLKYIEDLSSYIASKGKRYKSHYATILTWSRKNKPKYESKHEREERIFKEFLERDD